MKIDKEKLTTEKANEKIEEEKGQEEKTLYENEEDVKTQKWKEDSLNLRATQYVSFCFIKIL